MIVEENIIKVANAIFNAVGVKIRNLPITPEKVLRGKIL